MTASPPKRHALLLAVCCTAQFMVILDVAIVNVALRSIRSSLGFSVLDLVWIVNAYTIAFAGFLMLGGRASDLFGQRRTFIAGLLLFAAASLAGGLAGSQGMLIGARAAQGLGGAVMAPASLAIITSSFPAGPERIRAVGLWGAMNGAGGATGTLLGGVITQEAGWRWILLINLPIGIAAALVARVAVAERRREGPRPSFDLAGALTVTGGLLALVYGIVSAGSRGWGSLNALGPIGAGLVLLALFVAIEGRLAKAPLVPLRVFANRLLRMSNVVVVLFSAALFPMWYLTTLYMQEVLHFSPLGAGVAFLPMALTIMACATRAGPLVARYGAGPVLSGGLALMAFGMALFARVSVNGSYVGDVMVPGLLVATGIGFSVVPSTIAATASAGPEEAGLASGLVNTSRQIGGALGLAILTSLAALYAKHLQTVDFRAPILALDDGFRLAYALGAALAAAGALVTLRFLPRLPQRVAPDAPPRAVEAIPAATGARASATTALAAAEPAVGVASPNGGPASSAPASASARSSAAPSAGSAAGGGDDAA
ncbi:MAG TPA: MFS transporter [Solirubrobacteraceae bacterium]|nr:MFS transporter [Solirubrobacteraceae bacterium]